MQYATAFLLGTAALSTCRRLPDAPGIPWTLVTDDGADPKQVQKFRDAGVHVEVAPAGS